MTSGDDYFLLISVSSAEASSSTDEILPSIYSFLGIIGTLISVVVVPS